VSQHLIMIATTVVAFLVGRLTAWPTIRRLRAASADAVWWLGHDPLTGMFNRVGLYGAHTLAAQGDPQPILILLIDLDDFKPVNDTHGHDVGDDLLVEIGDRITEAADMFGGVAARLAGDEFAVILPVRDHDLPRIADLFVTVVGRPVELTHAEDPVKVTVRASVGMAAAESTDPLGDAGLRRADIAMYHAKHHGGNQYAIYEPGMTMPDGTPRRGPRLRDLRQNGGVTA
jgi:diguanylate cyclase (GGDEF)-like protein